MTDLPLPSALTPADRMAMELIVREIARRRIWVDSVAIGEPIKLLTSRVLATKAVLEMAERFTANGDLSAAREIVVTAIGHLVDGMVDLATEPVEQRGEA